MRHGIALKRDAVQSCLLNLLATFHRHQLSINFAHVLHSHLIKKKISCLVDYQSNSILPSRGSYCHLVSLAPKRDQHMPWLEIAFSLFSWSTSPSTQQILWTSFQKHDELAFCSIEIFEVNSGYLNFLNHYLLWCGFQEWSCRFFQAPRDALTCPVEYTII